MNQTLERIKDIEKNGYSLDFGTVFEHAFENYKKIALYAGLALFVFGMIASIFISGILISTVGAEKLAEISSPEKLKLENFTQTQIFTINSISILISCLFSPFSAAFLKMAYCGERDQSFQISNLFEYYKVPFIGKIIFSTLLIAIVNLSLTTLFSLIHFEFFGTVISCYLSFLTLLTVPLIIFGNLSTIESIKYSIVIVLKQQIVILGLFIVAAIGTLVGFIACCIGILFTIPFFFSMNYVLYSSIIGFPNEIDNLNN